MRTVKKFRLALAAAFCMGLVAVGIALTARGQSVPQPVLKIAATNTTNVVITVTNGVSYANYEVYARPIFDPDYPWLLAAVGATGQTNFVTTIDSQTEFFFVGVGSDWDGDGIPNYMDANPTNASIGALTVTITTPANGAVVQ